MIIKGLLLLSSWLISKLNDKIPCHNMFAVLRNSWLDKWDETLKRDKQQKKPQAIVLNYRNRGKASISDCQDSSAIETGSIKERIVEKLKKFGFLDKSPFGDNNVAGSDGKVRFLWEKEEVSSLVTTIHNSTNPSKCNPCYNVHVLESVSCSKGENRNIESLPKVLCEDDVNKLLDDVGPRLLPYGVRSTVRIKEGIALHRLAKTLPRILHG
ncbi:hypothetical protein ACH5RR_033094 [Cinchona calisaya]|uniref:Uncharacterized protein n=1 Tax=Cinchona calisaya TaxID=153742 RepID=A0ABD2YN47_9GENT